MDGDPGRWSVVVAGADAMLDLRPTHPQEQLLVLGADVLAGALLVPLSRGEGVTVWLTVAQVAEEEGCSARTILRWIGAGHLEARRQPGGRLRIHADSYRALIERGSDARRIVALIGDEGGAA